MGLKFGHTCSAIDDSLKSAKSLIEGHIDSLIDELVCEVIGCDELRDRSRSDYLNKYTDYIYDDVQRNFEEVRATNEKMRAAADNQIDMLNDQISDLDNEIDNLRYKIDSLEQELRENVTIT